MRQQRSSIIVVHSVKMSRESHSHTHAMPRQTRPECGEPHAIFGEGPPNFSATSKFRPVPLLFAYCPLFYRLHSARPASQGYLLLTSSHFFFFLLTLSNALSLCKIRLRTCPVLLYHLLQSFLPPQELATTSKPDPTPASYCHLIN